MAKNFLTKKNFFYRFQQLMILIAHLVLLQWMIYTLSESGSLTFNEVFLHFFGMSLYGAALIRGCAYWAKYHHQKSLQHHS